MIWRATKELAWFCCVAVGYVMTFVGGLYVLGQTAEALGW